jgi:hypothetical protein
MPQPHKRRRKKNDGFLYKKKLCFWAVNTIPNLEFFEKLKANFPQQGNHNNQDACKTASALTGATSHS